MDFLRIATRVALSQPLSDRPDYGTRPATVAEEHFNALVSATAAIRRLQTAGKFEEFESDPEVSNLIAKFTALATSMTSELNRLNELAAKFESEA